MDNNVAYKIGQVIGLGISLVPAILCGWSLRHRRANKKCLFSLLLLMVILPVAGVFGVLSKTMHLPGYAQALLGLFMLVLVIASILLAILGLAEFRQSGSQFGRKRALLALVLDLCFIGFFAWGVAQGIRNAGVRAAAGPKEPPFVSVDLNYRYTSNSPWTRMEARKLNPVASFAMMRANPSLYFIVIAEKTGAHSTLDSAGLAEIAKAHLKSAVNQCTFTREEPVRLKEMEGVRFETDAKLDTVSLYYVHWVTCHKGYAYQLITWGLSSERERVIKEASQLFEQFGMLDEGKVGNDAGAAEATDYRSPGANFSVKLAGTRWAAPLQDMAKNYPSAEFGRSTAKDEHLIVVPLDLGGCDPSLDLLAKGIMARWGVVFPGEGVSDLRKMDHGPLTGYAFGFHRPSTPNIQYRAEILKGNGFAYLLLAFCLKGEGPNPALEEVLSRVKFQTRPKSSPPAKLPLALREAHAVYFNEIGLAAHRREAYAEAEKYFRRARTLDSDKPVYLENIADTLSRRGENRAALDLLKAEMYGAMDTQSLRALFAWIQKQSGDTEGAAASYATAFSRGLSDEGALQSFVALLCQQKKSDEALKVIEKYIREHDSIAVRLTQASVYRQQRQFESALKMLREQQEKFPGEAQIAMGIARTLFAAERYDESVKECEKLLANGQTTGEVYFQKGRAEYNLKHYREAKTSLEAALKEEPANADYKTYLEHLSGMLGQGANTALKNPIDPVALPEGLLASPPVDEKAPYFLGYGGYYVRDARAISHVKGKDFKTTEYRVVQVLDDSGVTRFSSFEIPFDPLQEEIFVNELAVTDRGGDKLFTGKVEDYYVMDDTSSGHATQRKVLHIPVSGVRPGCKITLTLTRRDLGEAREFRFGEYHFSRRLPVVQSLLFVQADRAAFKASASAGLTEQKCENGVYWMLDQPSIYRYEPLQADAETYLPMVWLGRAGTTWQEVAKEYSASIADRLALDDATRELAKEKVGKLTKPEDKVAALAGFVQREFTYKAIEFGRRARIPNTTEAIIKNRYGDCKDHALLLRQLLEAAGVRAHLALVNTEGEVRPELPSLDQFDHMVVFVSSLGKGTFIDCTDKDSPLACGVPAGLAKKEALVLDEKNPRLLTIPDYAPDANHIAITRKIELSGKADASVTEDVVMSGFPAAWYRHFFRRTESANRKKALQDELAGCAPALEIHDLALAGLDDVREPLTLHVSYRLAGKFHNSGNQIMGQLPAVWERLFLAMDAMENRQAPLRVLNPLTVESRIALALPQGYAPALVDPVQIDAPFARCSLKSTPEAGLVRLECKAQRPSGSYPAAQYAACQETLGRVLGVFEQNFVFKRTP